MGYWIELHCDIGADAPSDGKVRRGPFCHSHRGDMLGEMARTSAPSEIIRSIASQAKANGWVKTSRGWACPACKITLG